jgi:hypothetical protein
MTSALEIVWESFSLVFFAVRLFYYDLSCSRVNYLKSFIIKYCKILICRSGETDLCWRPLLWVLLRYILCKINVKLFFFEVVGEKPTI